MKNSLTFMTVAACSLLAANQVNGQIVVEMTGTFQTNPNLSDDLGIDGASFMLEAQFDEVFYQDLFSDNPNISLPFVEAASHSFTVLGSSGQDGTYTGNQGLAVFPRRNEWVDVNGNSFTVDFSLPGGPLGLEISGNFSPALTVGTLIEPSHFLNIGDAFPRFFSASSAYDVADFQVTAVSVPAPGVAGVIGLAGLTTMRRRRTQVS